MKRNSEAENKNLEGLQKSEAKGFSYG